MARMTLNAEERMERGSGALGKVRRAGWVPAVLYGKGIDPVLLKVNAKEVTKLLARAENVHQMMDLWITPGEHDNKNNSRKAPLRGRLHPALPVEGATRAPKKYVVMLKDYQVDIIDRDFRHIDFCKVDLAKKLQVRVPIHLTGKAEGLQKGGVVEQISREIEVVCLPDNIPQHLEVDITKLDIGDSVHAKEIILPAGVELVPETDVTIVSVVAPREEEPAPTPAEAAPTEGAPAVEGAATAQAPAADAKEKGAPAKEKGAPPKGAAPAGEKAKEPTKK